MTSFRPRDHHARMGALIDRAQASGGRGVALSWPARRDRASLTARRSARPAGGAWPSSASQTRAARRRGRPRAPPPRAPSTERSWGRCDRRDPPRKSCPAACVGEKRTPAHQPVIESIGCRWSRVPCSFYPDAHGERPRSEEMPSPTLSETRSPRAQMSSGDRPVTQPDQAPPGASLPRAWLER